MDRNALMGSSLEQYLTPWMQRPEYQPKPTYRQPWEYPAWAAQNGEMRNAQERPRDWSAPIAEAISPTMGAYGLGQGLGNALMHGREGDYKSAAGELGLLAAGAIMPGPKGKGIRAYHGSPHDFDKFDMSKIGTGEGAQAYGHGLYFAEKEDVAKTYKAAGNPSYQDIGVVRRINEALQEAGGNERAARELLNAKALAATGRERQQLFDAYNNFNEARTPGRLYEVRINADPADFLDWDKPLSQQSEKVMSAIEKFDPEMSQFHKDNYTGQTFMRDYSGYQADGYAKPSAATTQAMRDAGIPGIRYLDQGSRDAGEGSRNYVLFRDDIIDIVKKYGIAAAASMYGMDAVMQATGQQQTNALMEPPYP